MAKAKRKRSSGGGSSMVRSTRARAIVAGRKGGSKIAAAARDESHTIAAVVAAAAIGYAQREDMLSSVPHIDALGVEGTLGAVAWGVGKFMKSKVASHVATGLLAVAAYKLASEPSA